MTLSNPLLIVYWFALLDWLWKPVTLCVFLTFLSSMWGSLGAGGWGEDSHLLLSTFWQWSTHAARPGNVTHSMNYVWQEDNQTSNQSLSCSCLPSLLWLFDNSVFHHGIVGKTWAISVVTWCSDTQSVVFWTWVSAPLPLIRLKRN